MGTGAAVGVGARVGVGVGVRVGVADGKGVEVGWGGVVGCSVGSGTGDRAGVGVGAREGAGVGVGGTDDVGVAKGVGECSRVAWFSEGVAAGDDNTVPRGVISCLALPCSFVQAIAIAKHRKIETNAPPMVTHSELVPLPKNFPSIAPFRSL